jgi:PqqD family protein of HPr-rel-A system
VFLPQYGPAMVAGKPRVREDLGVVEFEGETVVFDPVRPEVHYLNATAGAVFAFCDGSATAAETARELAEAFGVPVESVAADVDLVLANFAERGLLTGNGRRPTTSPPDEGEVVRLYVPPSD